MPFNLYIKNKGFWDIYSPTWSSVYPSHYHWSLDVGYLIVWNCVIHHATIPNLLMDLLHLWDKGMKSVFSQSENTSAKSMFLYNTYAKYHSHRQYHHKIKQRFHVDMLCTSWHQFLITGQSTKEVLPFSSKNIRAHTANTVLTWMQDDYNLRWISKKKICLPRENVFIQI
jgi:hypothetical protein